MIEKDRWACQDCAWRGHAKDLLHGQHPFIEGEEVLGCPQCKNLDGLFNVCDEAGCWKYVSCGTPTADGYRMTCGDHYPNRNKK